jgi:KUP system potassium uptake protein
MSESHGHRGGFAAVVGAAGIVYGDIGTSPLYALEESVKATQLGLHSQVAVMGVLSLIFWSLALVVTVKYVVVMMRADNQGEGGILALLALVQRALAVSHPLKSTLVTLALAGTALFYCDSLITPAISVLSAIEGVELLDPGFERAVIPLTLVVIALLFLIQSRGTERVGRLFGPVMLLWFAVLAVTGALAIARQPGVLLAVNPWHAVELFATRPGLSLAIIGGVFLAVTGGEALYADMGHFGARPVRVAWFVLVWPALLINYFGQGALLLVDSSLHGHVLFALVPAPMIPALVLLATAATVIASQAVISGAFSVTRQAMQLDLLPRVRIRQTSDTEQGQIYVPIVNTVLWLFVTLFVLGFGSASALSGAYGASVVGTMTVTTLLGAMIAHEYWRWAYWRIALVFAPLLLIDLTFVVGNLTKLPDGGWVPVLMAGVLLAFFMTWRSGRARLRAALLEAAVPRSELSDILSGVTRVPGTGVFLLSTPDVVPSALIRNIDCNRVAHEQIVILYVEFLRVPRQDPSDRVRVEHGEDGVVDVRASYGFMETPDIVEALRAGRARGLHIDFAECAYFLGWHLVRARQRDGWVGLARRLFAWMQRRSTQAAEFFRMPSRRVIVIATEIEI